MRLADLDSRLVGSLQDGRLYFDCPFPACQAKGPHRVVVTVSAAPYHERDPRTNEAQFADRKSGKVKVWQAAGEYPQTVTLSPSVHLVDDNGQTTCWHGFITNGEVTV